MRAIRLAPAALLALPLLPVSPVALACGGFFCESVPIQQAAEQIVFRQDGDRITAMVRILYSGEAERFSWVIPVPNEPDLSLGADITFPELELATRPMFDLERNGEDCGFGAADGGAGGVSESVATTADGDDGVTIVAEESVGPFDTVTLRGDTADALILWLEENDYDLSENGRDLIEPYVEAGMLFVGVKLRNGESTDSIQPLVMEYSSAAPMIPIRLTAVAAEDDMGVLVWVVADARAVPENYLHVTPNYARLNWYTGTRNAYSSYQTLITAAMDEVEDDGMTDNGQGFATDFAGAIDEDLRGQLFGSIDQERRLRAELDALDALGGDAADFIAQAISGSVDPRLRIGVLQGERVLPLPDGRTPDLYFDAQGLRNFYTDEQLGAARATLRERILEREIEPLTTALELFPEGAYMTRLFTTLSADEMTADPTFGYNDTMPDQPRLRRAVLDASCENGESAWTLTLAGGTDRDGEVVIRARQPVPFSVPVATDGQPASFLQARTSAAAPPETIRLASLGTLDIAADGSVTTTPMPDESGRDETGPDDSEVTDSPVEPASPPSVTPASSSGNDGFLGLAGPATLTFLSLFAWRRRAARRTTPD